MMESSLTFGKRSTNRLYKVSYAWHRDQVPSGVSEKLTASVRHDLSCQEIPKIDGMFTGEFHYARANAHIRNELLDRWRGIGARKIPT
jgi:hypothetical protein